MHDCDEKIKSPDLVVIDAYNGANEKEIKRKIRAYADHFKMLRSTYLLRVSAHWSKWLVKVGMSLLFMS